jgi:hypothetical protein
MAAQFTFHQRHLALGAVEMNGARDHLLAGPGLAGDEDRALRLRHQLRRLDDVLHARLRPTMPYWLNSSSRSLSR